MAKIRADQLRAALSKNLSKIFIVSGDEPLQVGESCDLIRHAAKEQGYSEYELHHVEAQFNWEELLLSANSLSLFADRKLIDLRIPSGKAGEKGNKALLQFCSEPPEDTLLLIRLPKLDAAIQKTKWFKSAESSGCVVQIWPITSQQLPRWLDNRAASKGLKLSSEALELLTAKTEGNLLAASQELEKLQLLAEDGQVSTELVMSLVGDSARYDVFELVDRALVGDVQSSVKVIQGLRQEGTDATVILWALSREIRTLSQFSYRLNQGQNFDRIAGQLRVWDKRKPLVRSAIKRLDEKTLGRLLRQANAIDKAIKGLRSASAWDELIDLVIGLCGVNALAPGLRQQAMRL